MLAFKIRPTAKHAPHCLTKSALSAPLKEQFRLKRVTSRSSLDHLSILLTPTELYNSTFLARVRMRVRVIYYQKTPF